MNWVLIGGLVLALAFAIVVVLILKGGKKKGEKKVGRVVATETQVDHYRLVNLMMTGQTSQVWEASDIPSGRHFGLKMLLPENAHTEKHRHFLFHEADVGQKIIHPNIIKMVHVVKDRDHPYLLMEFFPSTNLKLRVMHKEPFIKENFKKIVEQTALALAFMHERGWVHCDVKPDNILVNSQAEVRLIDFALAKRVAKRKKGMFGKRKPKGKSQGTRSYMSPEQIRGEPIDGRADIYSFGITIYELLTFRPPFRAATPGELLTKQLMEKPTPPQVHNPEISNDMSDLILSMLAKNPDDRPRDFHAFLIKFRPMRPFKTAPVARKPE